MRKISKQLLFASATYALSAIGASAAVSGADFTVDKVFDLFIKAACYFGQFAELVAAGAIIVFGIMMAMSQGNEAKFTKARDSLLWAVIGTLVIFGTYTIIITLANLVGGDYPITLFTC